MHGMIALQVAFCFLVLFVAGLFVATFDGSPTQPIGFSAERLLLLETTSRPAQSQVYWDQIADHLRTMPGVERVGPGVMAIVGRHRVGTTPSPSTAGPPSTDLAYFLNVSPGWLDTMKIPLLGGRDFRNSDAYPNVAIVNETFAKKFLNDEHPVGRFFEKASDDGKRDSHAGRLAWSAMRTTAISMNPCCLLSMSRFTRPTARESFARWMKRPLSCAPLLPIRSLSPQSFRQEVPRVGVQFHVSNIRTQEEIDQAQTVRERLLATLAFFFGAVALMLASIGLYGVLNYSVMQQQRELGIRIALGGRFGHIARRVTAGIVSALVTGTFAGLLLGLASARYLESLLYQVKASDPGMLLIPAMVIFGAGLVAAIPPILRALQIDPVAMLRVE